MHLHTVDETSMVFMVRSSYTTLIIMIWSSYSKGLGWRDFLGSCLVSYGRLQQRLKVKVFSLQASFILSITLEYYYQGCMKA